MKWSQLKKRAEMLFADSVKKRVALHTTCCHKAPDRMGRAWITLDDKEIINMCFFAEQNALWHEATRLQQANGCTDFRNPDHQAGYDAAYEKAKATLQDRSILRPEDFHQSLFQYLNTSIEDALVSPDPIIRAMGMLDRRLGKRRLASIDIVNEHPLVRRLFEIRCEAEGLENRNH